VEGDSCAHTYEQFISLHVGLVYISFCVFCLCLAFCACVSQISLARCIIMFVSVAIGFCFLTTNQEICSEECLLNDLFCVE